MKNNKGITLIALVITIIVMLILVGVTISMAVNRGLFDYAGKAVGETQNALNQEQQLINDIIDEYIKPNLPETEEGEVFSAIYTSTQEYTDTNGDTAVIPKGFSVGKSEGINTIDDGLVIQDEDGNQFVWIPVEVTDTDTETNIASFYRSDWSNNARTTGLSTNYKEPYEKGYTEETAEYNAMVKSVYENGGFYIGRYETGSTTARTNVANGTTEMVVKRDAYPYTYVGWGLTKSDYTSNVIYNNTLDQGLGALALSKAMYADKDVGVTSTLCYGIQWDAMLDFIKDEKNVTDSTSWGNYCDSVWTITRTSAKYYDSTNDIWIDVPEEGLVQEEPTEVYDEEYGMYYYEYDRKILTTGASDDFVAKNIFDVAGNVTERTNEIYGNSYRVSRGGNYIGFGSGSPASYRTASNPNNSCESGIGFRAVLYIS